MSILIPNEAALTEWIATADAIFRDELRRPPALHLDPAGLSSMLQIAASGGTADDMVAAVRSSPEWHALHDAPPVPSKPASIIRSPFLFPNDSKYVTLPWDPPFTRDYLRADSWGITIPGAPWMPGLSRRHPERILSWFTDRYTPTFQDEYFGRTLSYGYTHLKLSYADSCGSADTLGDRRPPGFEQSLDQFVAYCQKVGHAGLYRQVVIGSKYFQPARMSAQQWADFADPIMDALIAAHAVDEFILGWEWDLWNADGPPTIQAFKHAGQKAHAAGCSFWLHFSPEKTSWFLDGDKRGRFGFWEDLGDDVDGINYQTDPQWNMRDTQDRVIDTLWHFGQAGNRWKFRFDEDQAARMWDNDHPDEDEVNARGYCAMCTTDDVRHTDAKVWGYGNGARRPDGTVL
jgi:hypothetical protein